jgi:hypothetical protein
MGQARLRIGYAAACSPAVFGLALAFPAHNWDMLPYIATALSYLGESGPPLLDRTLADLRATVDAARYVEMTTDPFRSAVSSDPGSLEQLLPFYQIRPLYVWLVIAVSWATGATLGQATLLVPAGAAAAIMAVSMYLLRRAPWPVFLAAPPLLFVLNLFLIARLSTPDALAGLLAIVALLAALRAPGVALALLPLLPLARTDFVLLAPLVALAIRPAVPLAAAALSVGAAAAIYATINATVGNYGHLTIFNYQLIAGPMPYPAELPISREVADYAQAYLAGAKTLVEDRELWLAGVALALAAATPGAASPRAWRLVAATMVFVGLHFLAFPAAFDRTYYIATWATTMLGLVCISRRLENRAHGQVAGGRVPPGEHPAAPMRSSGRSSAPLR